MIITFEEGVKQMNLWLIGYLTDTFRILINSKIVTGLL